MTARCTCPIDAAAIGSGSHCAKTRSGASPSCSRTTCARQLGRHRRRVLLQRGERVAHRLRAGRRRGSSPSGRASSARPSARRARRRRRPRCASGARRRARRAGRRDAVGARARCGRPGGSRCATPIAASRALRAATRVAHEAAIGRRRRTARPATTAAPRRDRRARASGRPGAHVATVAAGQYT